MSEQFIYIESEQIPLKEIPYEALKSKIVDPTTGKAYKGIVLEGIFGCLKETPNNNNRIYDKPSYLEFLQKLKKQILSPKGVYGELEHPEGYAVNWNNVSHKLIDVWYDEETQNVYGRLIILHTTKGLIAQQIVKSGGQLSISARAAGEAIKQSDGTIKAVVKLIVTFDLVYHPGFATAVLDYKCLNESQQFMQTISSEKRGFNMIIPKNQIGNLNESYNQYIKSECNKPAKDLCYYEWFILNKLNESQQEIQEQKMEDSHDSEKQTKQQKQLEKEVDDLKQSKNKFFQSVKVSQGKLFMDLGKSYYDNSAGFISNETVGEC